MYLWQFNNFINDLIIDSYLGFFHVCICDSAWEKQTWDAICNFAQCPYKGEVFVLFFASIKKVTLSLYFSLMANVFDILN